MHHHAQLIFVFLVEMGFHLVDQNGLDLLTSSDPPTSGDYRHKPLLPAGPGLPILALPSSLDQKFLKGKTSVGSST